MQAPEQKEAEEVWCSISDAARATRIPYNTMIRFLIRHSLTVKRNPRDEREKLVNLTSIKAILGED